MAPGKLLQDKVALVTGGGSGFGEAIAKLFAEEGGKVIIADINEANGHRVVSEIVSLEQSAEFVKTDITKESEWRKALDFAKNKFGTLDVLVNNAGWTYTNKDSLKVTETEYDRIFDINVKAIFHSVNVIVPHFIAQGSGNIINISSCITQYPTPGLMWYGATKAAVDMITRHLATEFSSKGIRSNAVLPSISETPLMKEFMGETPTAEKKARLASVVPLNRLCTPLDIAKAALYFASDYFNDYQTGILLRVDGGRYP